MSSQKQSKEIHDLKKQLLNVEQVGEENHDLRAQLSTMIKENEGLKAQFVLVEKEKQGLHDEILAVAKEHSDCQAQLVVDSTLLDRCGVKFDEAEARMAGNDDLILKLHVRLTCS